jgi:serine/threonine protein kinase
MPQIQNIEPSRVVHELVLKPFGTYIIRSSTVNDDILSQMKIKPDIKSIPYVVLSVRVDENVYHRPIMNYRLPFIESNDKNYLLEHYRQIQNNELPKLEKECIIETEDTDWKIDESLFRIQYIHMSLSPVNDTIAHMKCNLQNGCNEMKVFKKPMKDNGQEFSILKTLSYFHIVTFYGICEESSRKKYLIFADHGESLKQKYPDIKCPNKLMIKQLSMIGYQIACGMIYLEFKHIIHRDLHAGNILIDEQNLIRIADFEHAIIKDENNHGSQESLNNSKSEFKIRRLSPECLPELPENTGFRNSYETLLTKFSSKSDVWAYGLIFIELIIGLDDNVYSYLIKSADTAADSDKEIRQLIQHIKIKHKIHRKPSDCPENLYNVLKRCWKYDPDRRISFMDVRNEMLKLFQSDDK